MRVNELKNKLDEIGVPQNLYSIMTGGLPNERLCIVNEKMWQVYYSERGKKVGLNFLKLKKKPVNIFIKR